MRVVRFRGVRVAEAASAFISLAQLLDLVDLMVAGDAMVRLGLVTPAELAAFAESSSQPGALRARRAAAYVRADVDSPMETRLRMLIVIAGYPEPVVNHVIRDTNERVVIRLDLSYPLLRLAIEYDGRQHAEDSKQWRHDLVRREALDRRGWRLVVVTWKGIYEQPGQTLSRIASAWPDRAGGHPPALRHGWQDHFPSRV